MILLSTSLCPSKSETAVVEKNITVAGGVISLLQCPGGTTVPGDITRKPRVEAEK